MGETRKLKIITKELGGGQLRFISEAFSVVPECLTALGMKRGAATLRVAQPQARLFELRGLARPR